MNEIIVNKIWGKSPRVTIITPVYNRSKELKRAISSVEKQTYKNFEYIIINDGSTENLDDIVQEFMDAVEFPCMYIKKENGGVHTARNAGFRNARGEFLLGLDSDDELVPNALECFVSTWDSIPEEQKKDFREVVAQCMDENGNRVGEIFPENINLVSKEEANRICPKAEHIGMALSKVLKENLFPEPEGITFFTENVLWKKLYHKYPQKRYCINDMLRIYHTETEISLSGYHKKKTIQNCKNACWESSCFLNNNKTDYKLEWKMQFFYVIRYSVMKHILNWNRCKQCVIPLTNKIHKVLYCLFMPVTLCFAFLYYKKRVDI